MLEVGFFEIDSLTFRIFDYQNIKASNIQGQSHQEYLTSRILNLHQYFSL
jgi:hypothetical protein